MASNDASHFEALLDKYMQQCPTHGSSLTEQDVRHVAARLIMLEQGNQAMQSWPPGAALRFAASLLILLVQENLVESRQRILGIPVEKIYAIIQSTLCSENLRITPELLISAVEDADRTGTALALVRQPDVTLNLWVCPSLDALWTSSARDALQAIDDMTVVSDQADGTLHDTESAGLANVALNPSSLVMMTHRTVRPQMPTTLWPARPRYRSATAVAVFAVGLILGITGLLPLLLQAANVDVVGRDPGKVPTTSLLPLSCLGVALFLLLVRSTDRDRRTLAFVCFGIMLVSGGACGFAVSRSVANWPPEDLYYSQYARHCGIKRPPSPTRPLALLVLSGRKTP